MLNFGEILKKLGAAAIIGVVMMGLITVLPPMIKSALFFIEFGDAKARYEVRLENVEKKAEDNSANSEYNRAKIDKLFQLQCKIAIKIVADRDYVSSICEER